MLYSKNRMDHNDSFNNEPLIWAGVETRMDSTAPQNAEAMSNSDSCLDHVAFLIRRSGAFPAADDDFIRSLAEAAVWFSIPGGSPLFCQGDSSNAMYIVVSGLLGAYVGDGSGDERMVGRVGPGELVGEMGCITGETRSATARALRTSEVLAVSRDALEELTRGNPVVLLSLCRTVIGRLRSVQEGKPAQFQPRTYCLLPQVEEGDAQAFAVDFAAALATLGSTSLVTQDKRHDHTADSLSTLEAAHEYVVYLAERSRTPWTQLCLRQADTVLIVARGADRPSPIDPFREMISPGIPVDLVLLWPGHIQPASTAAWLDVLRPRGQFHVRARPDIGRVARLLTGKGLGLVLSGGAARGLAHIGVARALAEHSIPVDVICGTSMGALVGALIALEWDFDRMRRGAHVFSRRHPLWELVLPRVSLLSGRNVRTSLEDWYGEWGIEETPIRYACVSTNLTAGSATVHVRGKLKTWVLASTALPGVFPPVLDNDVVYVDGGVINNLPADIVRDLGAGFVVAVDVGAAAIPPGAAPELGGQGIPARNARAAPNILELLMRVGTMSSDTRGLMLRQQCDLLLIPDVQHLSLLNWRAYDQAIELGYRCTVDKIDQIKSRIREIRVPSMTGAMDF